MKSEIKGMRGTRVRSEGPPEHEKPVGGVSNKEALDGRSMGGGPRDVSHSIRGNKVPYK